MDGWMVYIVQVHLGTFKHCTEVQIWGIFTLLEYFQFMTLDTVYLHTKHEKLWRYDALYDIKLPNSIYNLSLNN